MRIANIVAAAAVSFLVAASAQAQTGLRIGSAAITDKTVTGTLGTTRRDLKQGDGVSQNETIATGVESRAQILFKDETALTIGPKSEIMLDKFVYDPDKKTGEVTLRAVTGAFRFVSGSAQKDAYKINTPAGSIGVRGTIIEFNIVPSPAGYIITLTLGEGATSFCLTPSQCTELTKPGTYIVISGNQISAEQVLNAVGCGAGKCNESSYKQGDQTTYIAFFSDNTSTPPPSPPQLPASGPSTTGDNPFQIALRAYLQHVVARLETAKQRHHVQGFPLLHYDANISLLKATVGVFITRLDTAQEFRQDKRYIRLQTRLILNSIGAGHHHRHHRRPGRD